MRRIFANYLGIPAPADDDAREKWNAVRLQLLIGNCFLWARMYWTLRG